MLYLNEVITRLINRQTLELITTTEVANNVLHMCMRLVENHEIDDKKCCMEDQVEAANQDRTCFDPKLNAAHG